MFLESEGLTCVAEVKVALLDQRRRRVSIREALYVNTCCPSWEVLSPLLSQSGDPPVNFDQPRCCSERPPPQQKKKATTSRQADTDFLNEPAERI